VWKGIATATARASGVPGSSPCLVRCTCRCPTFETHTEDIIFCEWCGAVVTFEQGDPIPSDAPKGACSKHKTHSNRRFCKEKHGVKDYCKNKFSYDRRKRATRRP
jgi:hypothetical protein